MRLAVIQDILILNVRLAVCFPAVKHVTDRQDSVKHAKWACMAMPVRKYAALTVHTMVVSTHVTKLRAPVRMVAVRQDGGV